MKSRREQRRWCTGADRPPTKARRAKLYSVARAAVAGVMLAACVLAGVTSFPEGIATTPVAWADYCPFVTIHQEVPIRAKPRHTAAIRGWLRPGQIAYGPCDSRGFPRAVLDNASGVVFTPVICSCANGGVGWYNSAAARWR